MVITWQDWDDGVLERARSEQRVVLLSIVASWCRFCTEMDETTFADGALGALVAETCLPVRADKDEMPELDGRYGQGGWPSTVLIAPSGDVLAAGTFWTAEELAEQVRAAADSLAGRPASERRATADHGPVDPSISPAIEHSLLADFDERYGGFGNGQKFPHSDALDYAILRHAECRNPRLHEIIEKTLTKMSEGGLLDAVDGGFFRCCQRRDWSQPLTEKALDSNAGLARNYLEAGQLMGRADFLSVGERTIDALVRDFFDEEAGLLHGAIDADDDYYALDAAGRVTRQPPRRSGRFLADGNARAVSALLKAGAVLARDDLTETALRLAENLLRRLWRPGHGMYHFADAGGRHLPGRLRDQAETARAVLHVLQYVDDRRFLAPLEDLIETITSEHVTASGEFVDRDGGAPSAAARAGEKQILDGAVAAEVLLRGAIFLSRPELAEMARGALELHVGDFRRYGYAMAAYGRSVELLIHPPLHVVVLGEGGDARAEALLAAASATYLPSRVVQRLDPAHDSEQIARLGLPERESPTTFVFLARDCAGEHTDPAALRTALLDANARRLRG